VILDTSVSSRHLLEPLLLIYKLRGSADLWVASSACGSGCPQISNVFNASTSSTFKDSSLSLDIIYGSGEVKGTVGT
jgi:hypothetical protein